jgi:hypothetical protein
MARRAPSTTRPAAAATAATDAAAGTGAGARRDALCVAVLLPLTTFSVLSCEIVLTRLFAYIFSYHMTALAVSLAVFGLGAGAWVRVRWLSARAQSRLAAQAHLAMGVSLIALYLLLMLTHDEKVVVLASMLPFFFAGVAVSHYYQVRRAERAAATCALDLAGAAAACATSLFLLRGLGGDGALLLLAALSGGLAALAATRVAGPRRVARLVPAAGCSLLAVVLWLASAQLPDPLLNSVSGGDKQLPQLLRAQGRVTDSAWSAVGRADLFQSPHEEDRLIFSDAMNSTVFLAADPQGLQGLFAALPFALAPVRSALIVGSGAGLEVRVARAAGVADIEAVELNDAIIRLVRKWQSFGGPIYEQPGVKLAVEEGRKYVLTQSRRYDLIQMSLVLTATAQSGTYALAEGYLYTEEAFRSYLDHLEPGGALAMIDDSYERTLRNAVTAVTVLQRSLGLRSEEAMKHVAVVFNARPREPGYKYLLLVSPTALSEARLQRLNAEVPRWPLQALWLPGLAGNQAYRSLSEQGTAAFLSAAELDYSPPTDDRPYLNFFAKTPRQTVEALAPYLGLSLLMAAVLVAMGAARASRRVAGGRRPLVLASLYGVGFMFIELGLLHKLTLAAGGPTHVLSILLFALLLYCGLGSLLFGRFAGALRRVLGAPAILVTIVGVATTEIVERVYRLEGISSPVLRAACVMALVAPIGLCLGAPFPDLLRRHGQADERRVAFLWAVNGIASVLGGSLSLVLLPTLGGHVLLLAGCAVYLGAWAVDRRGALVHPPTVAA